MIVNCKCQSNGKPTVIAKSYGTTFKINSKSVRYDSATNKTTAQCNYCRDFVDIPVTMNVEPEKFVITESIAKSDQKYIVKK